MVHRALTLQLKPKRWHRATLAACADALRFQQWRIHIHGIHKQETLQQIVDEEYKLGFTDDCWRPRNRRRVLTPEDDI